MAILIANIGDRDVTMKGPPCKDHGEIHPLFCPALAAALREETGAAVPTGVRHLGAWLDDEARFVQFSNRLDWFILWQALELLWKRVDRFDRVYLVATNQPEPPATKEFHWARDTIHAAHLVRRMMKRDYPDQIGPVDFIQVESSPNEYDVVYDFLGRELRSRLGGDETVVAAISGGIPALITGVRDHVLGLCGKNAILVQTIEGRDPKVVSTWTIRRDTIIRQVRELLTKGYDYAGALALLEDEGFAFSPVKEVLLHAQRRFNLDLKGAVEAVQGIRDPTVQAWQGTLQPGSQWQRLREIMLTCEVCRQAERWVDLIWRVDSFRENVLHVLAGELYHWPSAYVLYEDQLCLEKSKLDRDLTASLERQLGPRSQCGPGLSLWQTTEAMVGATLDFAVESDPRLDDGQKEAIRQLRNRLATNRWERLADLRNRVIHQLGDLTAEAVDRALQPVCSLAKLSEEMETVVVDLVAAARPSPHEGYAPADLYDDLNAFVLNRLEALMNFDDLLR